MPIIPSHQNGKRKILVVDDEKAFGVMLKLNLEQIFGYQVRVETDGANAFVAAKEFQPNLIFLDVIMPKIRGEEIVWKLMNDNLTKSIPVVFLTALDATDSKNGKRIFGQLPVLSKPASLDEVISCIEQNLRN